MKPKSHIAILLAASLALALGACSSSSDDPPPGGNGDGDKPKPAAVDMTGVHADAMVDAGTLNIPAGQSRTLGDVTYSCPAGGMACMVVVMADGMATSAGGTATAANSEGFLARMKIDEMEDDKRTADMKAAMETARKLHMGISAPDSTSGAGERSAEYDTDGNVEVTIGEATAVDLKEDKKATVADNHGWMGKKYTAAPTGGGKYEAVVYSNVGEPTEGDPFNEEYTLSDGMVTVDTTQDGEPAKVASTRFDQSAGSKMFKLPDPNPQGATKITVPGMYHGVSGTFSCTPTNADSVCTSVVAASGFTLTGGTWTFEPSNPKAKVSSVKDMNYASYGWWIHKSADGKTFTASAFVADMGTVAAADGITALRGTAKYMGGAAGKYALYSSTGGTNDAGHFTAKAMLEADFNADMISGTIDTFMGADGKARDWSVELKKTAISNAGAIAGDGTTGNTDPQKTVWTIGGTAAAAAGQWDGMLKDNGDDGVPKVATGTFYSMYSTSGKMVGGFGATKQ